jgi:hypothetical protein
LNALVLLLLVLGTLLVGLPEFLRLANRWPHNWDTENPVIGPGDTVTVHLPGSIRSVNGHWRARPRVELVNARSLGLANDELPAASKSQSWGKLIITRDTRDDASVPWVKLTIPSAPADLRGKKLELLVTLDLLYPKNDGFLAYREVKETRTYNVELRLASQGAGRTYFTLWPLGLIVGGLTILLGGVFLLLLALRLKRWASPVAVVPASVQEID